MGAGDFFGEGGLVLNMPRSASIRAVTPIQVIRYYCDNFMCYHS
jgi:CRP-like cAMP-binding protein